MDGIFIYSENCRGIAGQTVPVNLIEAYDGDPLDCADWRYFTPEDLDFVRERVKSQIGTFYWIKVLKTLVNAWAM